MPGLLRDLRDEAGLTQRELGARLGRPQSWVYGCEVGNRRVDVAEFAAWARGCGADPAAAFARFLGSSADAAADATGSAPEPVASAGRGVPPSRPPAG